MGSFAIIGGAGFIGSHFVDQLLETSASRVLAIDNLSSGSKTFVQKHLQDRRFQFIEGSAENTIFLQEILLGIDTVIHLASNPDIAKAITYPRVDFEKGTLLTESVLEACRLSQVKTVLYASGSGVYKESSDSVLGESFPLEPISTYGASKLAGESLMSAYSYMFGMKCISFRFANVVGPRQTHGVGYDFVRKLRNNPTKLEILGNGTQTKSYIHVLDVVSAVLLANSRIESGYEVFNVATQDVLTVKEIAEITIETLQMNSGSVEITFGVSDRGWKSDVPKVRLDSRKLRALGWNNHYSSYSAMKNAIASMAN